MSYSEGSGLTITFSHSPSKHFEPILVIAREATGYREEGRGKAIKVTVSYDLTPADMARAAELWGKVAGWKSARLLLDGAPVLESERLAVLDVLQCAAHSVRFAPKSQWCRTAEGMERLHPPIPCRILSRQLHGEWARFDWKASPERSVDRLRVLAEQVRVARCPFLDLTGLVEVIQHWTPPPALPPLPTSLRIDLNLDGGQGLAGRPEDADLDEAIRRSYERGKDRAD